VLRRLDDLARSDLIIVAAGLLIALATFELVKAIVENLIMSIIFTVFGQSEFPFLSFTIDNTEFAYGFVISAAIAVVIVCLLVIPLWKVHRKYEANRGRVTVLNASRQSQRGETLSGMHRRSNAA
jgi:large-conductance mechanosensitive channel